MRFEFSGRRGGKTERLRAMEKLFENGQVFISKEFINNLVLDKNKSIDVEFRVVKDPPQLPEKI